MPTENIGQMVEDEVFELTVDTFVENNSNRMFCGFTLKHVICVLNHPVDQCLKNFALIGDG